MQSIVTHDPDQQEFAIGLSIHPFNWKMRKLRRQMNLTQAQLAELADVSIAHVQSLESFAKNYTTTSWLQADRIASVLESSVDELFPPWLQSQKIRELLTGDLPLPISEADGVINRLNLVQLLGCRLRETIEQKLATLSTREQTVLKLRCGWDGGHPVTIDETARQFGVTRERIRQIEARALRKLRYPSRSRDLRSLLTERAELERQLEGIVESDRDESKPKTALQSFWLEKEADECLDL